MPARRRHHPLSRPRWSRLAGQTPDHFPDQSTITTLAGVSQSRKI